jgi:hypothetical protein
MLTGQTKDAAMTKLNNMIETGRAHAGNVIEHVMRNQPDDYLVTDSKMNFVSAGDGLRISFGDNSFGLHKNALGQLAENANVPTKFMDSLTGAGDWGHDLLAHNLNEIYSHREAKHLLRATGGQVRGFLSDRYRRLDSRPIVEAFATGVQALGAVPYEGYVMDTKIAIKAIMPQLWEPVPGEIMGFGVALENSDFGNGALSFRTFVLRIWCTNLAIFEEAMRQIHLGKRLDDAVIYSNETYELDSKTTVSALGDLLRAQLALPSINSRFAQVEAAAARGITGSEAMHSLKKLLATKDEVTRVVEAFNSPDVEMLPAGNTNWRLSNAISWVATKETNTEKKLDLMKAAGAVLAA